MVITATITSCLMFTTIILHDLGKRELPGYLAAIIASIGYAAVILSGFGAGKLYDWVAKKGREHSHGP